MRTLILSLLMAALAVSEPPPVYAVSMIVKNERKILPRLFASLSNYVSYYMICDTGSTDGTPDFARKWLTTAQRASQGKRGMGAVHEDQWIGYAYNRNTCLRRLQDMAKTMTPRWITHVLLMDGDFELVVQNETRFTTEAPPAAQNLIAYEGATFYRQPLLISLDYRCGYLTVTHEYLMCVDNPNAYELLTTRPVLTPDMRHQIEASVDPKARVANYDAIKIRHHMDGANRGDKFERDIALLQNDIINNDPENERSWFYLARSLEDGGYPEKAFNAYLKRVEMGGHNQEELWYSVLRMGYSLMANGSNIEEAARYFVDAFNYKPTRREPLAALAKHYRMRGKYSACKMYGFYSLSLPLQTALAENPLFLDLVPYEWGVHDDVALCMYELGEYEGAYLAGSFLVNNLANFRTLDAENAARIKENFVHFGKKYTPPPPPAAPVSPAPSPAKKNETVAVPVPKE